MRGNAAFWANHHKNRYTQTWGSFAHILRVTQLYLKRSLKKQRPCQVKSMFSLMVVAGYYFSFFSH